RKKIGNHAHRPGKAEGAVQVAAEFALGDESVDMIQRSRERPRVAPQLRGTPIAEHAAQAMPLVAQLAVVSPQDVRWTDEPVLVRFVDLEAVAPGEESRSADKRHVVIPHHVEGAGPQDLREAGSVDHRAPELVHEQARAGPEATAQSD